MSLKTVDVDDDRRAATARALADAEALLRREREEREEREDDDEEREDFANQILPSDSDDDAPYEHDDALPPSTLFTGEGVVVKEDVALADDDDGSISLALTNVASARRKPNAPPESMKNLTDRQARSMSHWSPYDPVGVVNADS